MTRMNIFFVSSRRIQTLPNANLSKSLYDHFADLPIEERDRPHVVAFAPNKPIKNRGDAKVQEDVAALGDLSSGDTAQRIDAYVPLSEVLPMPLNENDVHVILKGLPVTLTIYVKDNETFHVVKIPETTELNEISSYIKRDSISAVYTLRKTQEYRAARKQEIAKNISQLGEDGLEEQELYHTIGKVFPGAIRPDIVHLIVTAVSQEEEPSLKRQRSPGDSDEDGSGRHRRSPPFPGFSETISPRETTVTGIWDKLLAYHFIWVRGTPASGKSTLVSLLYRHASKVNTDGCVHVVGNWPSSTSTNLQYLTDQGVDLESKTGKIVIIFDEAQLTYHDTTLWTFFKAVNALDHPHIYVIGFSAYGSAMSRFMIRGTPVDIEMHKRVSLNPIDHRDGFPAVGLLFTKEEYDELVIRYEPHRFDQSFLDVVFDLTEGHIGAIKFLFSTVLASDKYREVQRTPECFTSDMFHRAFPPEQLALSIQDSGSIFSRGLPLSRDLQDEKISKALILVAQNVTISPTTLSLEDTLQSCVHQGWLHSDAENDGISYRYPSTLHRWFVQWKLFLNKEPERELPGNLEDFAFNVVGLFNPVSLLQKRQISPGHLQRQPEAHYQDEFYRASHAYSNGSVVVFPEYGTKKGRVDFYVPSMKWAIELLRDGNEIQEHSDRFGSSGVYSNPSWKESIVLDFRTTFPRKTFPNIRNLYHIIFEDHYGLATIQDHMNKVVKKLRLINM